MGEAEIEDPVREMLAWVGLADRASARPPTLSGGEQQRVAIARAVIARPELLVADEPTGNVDADMAKRLLHLFSAMNQLGTTVVVATHDLSLIARDPGRRADPARERAAGRPDRRAAQPAGPAEGRGNDAPRSFRLARPIAACLPSVRSRPTPWLIGDHDASSS